VRWRLADGAELLMVANVGETPCEAPFAVTGRVLFELPQGLVQVTPSRTLPGWSVAVAIKDSPDQ
jgi:hypothetical protein